MAHAHTCNCSMWRGDRIRSRGRIQVPAGVGQQPVDSNTRTRTRRPRGGAAGVRCSFNFNTAWGWASRKWAETETREFPREITREMRISARVSRNQKTRKVEARGEGRNNCTCENAESVRLKRNTNRHPHPTGREAGRRRSGKSKNRTEINKKSLVYNGVLSQTGHGRLSASRTGPTVSIHARAPRPALGWETRRGARLCVYTALGSNLRLAPPPALEATQKGRDGKKKTSSPLAGKRGSGKYKTWAS
jgi:hypothetical protein